MIFGNRGQIIVIQDTRGNGTGDRKIFPVFSSSLRDPGSKNYNMSRMKISINISIGKSWWMDGQISCG